MIQHSIIEIAFVQLKLEASGCRCRGPVSWKCVVTVYLLFWLCDLKRFLSRGDPRLLVGSLTPSLPQPLKLPGWNMHGRACKQYIFRFYNIYFQCCTFWCKSFDMPVRQRKQKSLRVSTFVFSLAIFKRHHGSEGVQMQGLIKNLSLRALNCRDRDKFNLAKSLKRRRSK